MKFKVLVVLFFGGFLLHSQEKPQISTMEFVEILNNNKAEALYYFKNNWKVLREKALAKDDITGFNLMESKKSEESPFDLILMTSYANKEKYMNREQAFQALISQSGGLKLLNKKKPSEFRRSVFAIDSIKHQ
ncbi:hypothetical protein MTsPCn9_12040 [Croceitalea sp. MTPC9]|uniref:hypothetical protein n=1 Tax=unclassified Croceitalea TaxID=2632280 RepID=UPI002B3DABE6|nr:hypothetical protein MTsPCn6_31600 [Croceitalea sp. MTPC6]GMN16268.1 hypothetical protein MTsPCn9_12040 [Croceitalea sp. MTPC9]